MPLKSNGVISALYVTTIVGTTILTPGLAPYISERSDEKRCREELEKVRRDQKRGVRKRELQLKANERAAKERYKMERMTDEEYFGWMG
jgi:hypothetical protein